MNGSAASKILVPIALVVAAVYLTVDIVASGGNVLGRVYSYLLVGSALFGLFSPRSALIYLVFLTGYLDGFKRLMILDSGITTRDLYFVLGIAPATMFGIMLGLLNASLQSRIPLVKGQAKWIMFVLLAQTGMMGLSIISVGKNARALGDSVNLAAYIGLLMVIPLLFRTSLELARFLKTVLWIFVPSAIYIIYQSFAGPNSLELAYLKSGLTIEIKQLYEVKFRPFGTMNSASSASVVFAVLSIVALFGPWNKRFKEDNGRDQRVNIGLPHQALFLLFAVACYVTLGRTGWISGIIGCALAILFRYRALTISVYVASVSGALLLILGSSWILRTGWLERTNSFLMEYSSSREMDRQLTVGTFSDRLVSFTNLTTDHRLWTPFGWKMAGIPESKKPLIHDAITDTLVKFGYIPWCVLIIITLMGIFKMHQIVLSQESSANRTLGSCCAAAVFVLGLGCLSSWSQLFAFPINFYVWVFPGVLAAMHFGAFERAGVPSTRQGVKKIFRDEPFYRGGETPIGSLGR